MLSLAAITVKAQDNNSLENDRTAILLVHFGSTFDDTRSRTIDAIKEKVKTRYPNMRVEEAFTSRIIIKRLKDRGIVKQNPQEALLKLAAEGYKNVVIQSTNVIEGMEMEVLRKEASLFLPFFSEVRVGRPLLYSIDDCLEVVEILKKKFAAEASGKNSAVVFVGHGTSTPANAIYSQIDYIFAASGSRNFHVTTIEGYPTFDTTLSILKSDRTMKVTLVPFMFVAGDHARNDIDGEWRDNLTKEGFEVKSVLEGLGEIPEIQNIYLRHLKDAMTHPLEDALTKKSKSILNSL